MPEPLWKQGLNLEVNNNRPEIKTDVPLWKQGLSIPTAVDPYKAGDVIRARQDALKYVNTPTPPAPAPNWIDSAAKAFNLGEMMKSGQSVIRAGSQLASTPIAYVLDKITGGNLTYEDIARSNIEIAKETLPPEVGGRYRDVVSEAAQNYLKNSGYVKTGKATVTDIGVLTLLGISDLMGDPAYAIPFTKVSKMVSNFLKYEAFPKKFLFDPATKSLYPRDVAVALKNTKGITEMPNLTQEMKVGNTGKLTVTPTKQGDFVVRGYASRFQKKPTVEKVSVIGDIGKNTKEVMAGIGFNPPAVKPVVPPVAGEVAAKSVINLPFNPRPQIIPGKPINVFRGDISAPGKAVPEVITPKNPLIVNESQVNLLNTWGAQGDHQATEVLKRGKSPYDGIFDNYISKKAAELGHDSVIYLNANRPQAGIEVRDIINNVSYSTNPDTAASYSLGKTPKRTGEVSTAKDIELTKLADTGTKALGGTENPLYRADTGGYIDTNKLNPEELKGINIKEEAVSRMTELLKNKPDAFKERPIALTVENDGRLKIVEGFHRAAAAQRAGVKIPYAIVDRKKISDMNAPEIDRYAKRIFEKSTSQKSQVAKSISESPKTIKQITEETKILEPNVRRILGVGAKEGTFTRVEKGVYVLSKDGEDLAYIEAGDANESLKRLVKEGWRADAFFVDAPYKTKAVRGGGEKAGKGGQVGGGVVYGLIKPDYFRETVSLIKQASRKPNTPVVHMFSNAPSGWKQMVEFNNEYLRQGFKLVGKGEYTKVSKSGERLGRPTGAGYKISEPEGILVFTQSGELDKELQNLNFKLVRPPRGSYSTEKPEEMLRKIIEMTTEEGDIVFDPFAGSGVTGAAAIKSGRRAYLIEKNPDVVENVIKPRIERAAAFGKALKEQNRADWNKKYGQSDAEVAAVTKELAKSLKKEKIAGEPGKYTGKKFIADNGVEITVLGINDLSPEKGVQYFGSGADGFAYGFSEKEIASKLKAKPLAQTASDPLLQEARGKSFDEFLKGQGYETISVDKIKPEYYLPSNTPEQPGAYKVMTNKKVLSEYQGVVNSYKEKIKAGQVIDPIIINEKNVIVDGQHKFDAYKQLGLKEIPVKIGNTIDVFNKNIKTKSQLLDIWKKANQSDLASQAKPRTVNVTEKSVKPAISPDESIDSFVSPTLKKAREIQKKLGGKIPLFHAASASDAEKIKIEGLMDGTSATIGINGYIKPERNVVFRAEVTPEWLVEHAKIEQGEPDYGLNLFIKGTSLPVKEVYRLDYDPKKSFTGVFSEEDYLGIESVDGDISKEVRSKAESKFKKEKPVLPALASQEKNITINKENVAPSLGGTKQITASEFINRLARANPDFAANPVLVSEGSKLVFRSGNSVTKINKEIFGLTDPMPDGVQIRLEPNAKTLSGEVKASIDMANFAEEMEKKYIDCN